MNTSVHLWHFSRNAGMVHYIERLFARNEQTLSRFDPQSDLSQLNRNPDHKCRIGSDLFSALEQAFWFAGQTDGIYEPAVLPVLERIGYDRSYEQIVSPVPGERSAAKKDDGTGGERPSFRDVSLDRIGMTVTRPVGMRFDLGGIGKGWTVDRASDLLHREGPFFLNAGGDIYAGGAPDQPKGWDVEIEDPLEPTGWIARVRIRDRALATSALNKRRWQCGERRVHHLIDPRSQDAAETDLLSVTVIAGRTAIAEVLAKTALILGADAGKAFLERWPDAEALLFTKSRQILWTTGFEPYLETENMAGRRSIQ